jgi:adenylyl cyclase-associated protein
MVNCQRLQVQVKGIVPAIAIDKTDGCQVFLSFASRDAQIVTSKSSELNLSFPATDAEDSDWTELPIPEQFVTKLVGNKLHTTVSDLYSS